MRVAILGESPVDEAAVRILVESILVGKTQQVEYFRPRSRGWPSVLRVLPNVLQHLHYRTDAEGLVVVADLDDSPLHHETHDQLGGEDKDCRLCRLRAVLKQTQQQVSPIVGRPIIKTAIGIAVPALEAWFRCGLDPHVSEAEWQQGVESRPGSSTRRKLKEAVYGSERVTEELAKQRAVEEAQRLAQDLTLLEQLFPAGFGALARDIRGW